jgi:hypothetical protein
MNKQCKFKVGKYNCGSYAFNLYKEQIDQGDRCDQHYWQEKAMEAAAQEREACVKECKKLIKVFLSSQYKTGQPLSSFGERHAVAACIEAIEARGIT